MTTLPTRQQVAAAAPLDFDHRQGEKLANISIEAVCDGYTVRIEYTGSIATVKSACEKLRAAGLEPAQPAQSAPAPRQQARAGKVAPAYDGSGTPICPVHGTVLRQGQYGLFCPSKDPSTERGYCALRFDA